MIKNCWKSLRIQNFSRKSKIYRVFQNKDIWLTATNFICFNEDEVINEIDDWEIFI